MNNLLLDVLNILLNNVAGVLVIVILMMPILDMVAHACVTACTTRLITWADDAITLETTLDHMIMEESKWTNECLSNNCTNLAVPCGWCADCIDDMRELATNETVDTCDCSRSETCEVCVPNYSEDAIAALVAENEGTDYEYHYLNEEGVELDTEEEEIDLADYCDSDCTTMAEYEAQIKAQRDVETDLVDYCDSVDQLIADYEAHRAKPDFQAIIDRAEADFQEVLIEDEWETKPQF